jgi:rod shape-determining protein MreC
VNLRLNKFKKKTLLYPIIGVALLLILASTVPFLRTPFLHTLKYPLSLLTLMKRQALGIIFYHRNMVQNESLKKEMDLLQRKINSLNEIYLENERLNKLLSLKQKSSYKVIAARVIGRSPDNWSSLIIIDKGSRHGIRTGYVAITYLGIAGRVTETAAYTSKIMLINDPNLGVSAIVQRSRQEGLVCGTLGSSLIMKYLTKEADVKVLDVVITSGLTKVFPKGLLIGTVVDIGEEFSGLSKYAVIKPAVNLSGLEEVLIIVQ